MAFVCDLSPNTAIPVIELPAIVQKLKPETWPDGCPVQITELDFIKLVHWGFDDQEHIGELIVNREVTSDILKIFFALYINHFPIEQIRPIYIFNNDDEVSMEQNNTSAFNCREVTGLPGIFSQHAYGRAIDINPKLNPYVIKAKNLVLPKSGREHIDREVPAKGKINRYSLPFMLFTASGWDWGDWNDVQDYQHFEKRANGEKRNPDGYSMPMK